jgi:hypothetical protein
MQSRNDGGAILCHLPVGEPDYSEAKALQLCVAATVRFEGGAVRVMPVAIGLDDQRSVAPEEIDLEWPEPGIHLWLRKAVAAAEVEEETLELAAGEIRVAIEVAIRDQPKVQRSPDCPPKHRLGNRAVEVAERSRRPCDGHTIAPGHQTGTEGDGSVNPDARAAPAASIDRQGEVD